MGMMLLVCFDLCLLYTFFFFSLNLGICFYLSFRRENIVLLGFL